MKAQFCRPAVEALKLVRVRELEAAYLARLLTAVTGFKRKRGAERKRQRTHWEKVRLWYRMFT